MTNLKPSRMIGRYLPLLALACLSCSAASAQSPSFIQPATEYTTTMKGAPSMAVFKSRIYLAFQANDSSYSLYLKVSNTSGTFSTPATNFPSQVMSSAPKLGATASDLFVTYSPEDLIAPIVEVSTDGANFASVPVYGSGPVNIGNICGLATFQGEEYLFCTYNPNLQGYSNYLNVFAYNGSAFYQTAAIPIASANTECGAPSAVEFNNTLYVAYLDCLTNYLAILKSTDGVNFTPVPVGGGVPQMDSAPTISVFNNELQVAFQAYAYDDYLFVKTSDSSGNFSTPSTLYSTQIGASPGLALFNGDLYMSFLAANGTDRLFTTYATH